MDITVGNAHDAATCGTGWMVGFGDWTSGLLRVPRDQPLSGLCVKWFDHPTGDDSGPGKPLSEGRTLSLLVSAGSAFRIELSESADFPPGETRIAQLGRHGDFAAWGPGLFHRWHCLSRATILTIRWQPDP
jgi:hypothetical protein